MAAGAAAFVSVGAAPGGAGADRAALVFRGVTVIDVTDGRRLGDQTVVVVGNRIEAVGPADKVRAPAGARVVEARGKYMIPGLWDMHVHPEFLSVPSAAGQDSIHRWASQRLIANGVTGIRPMAQRWPGGADSFRVWQRASMAGTRLGPRAIGPSYDIPYTHGPKAEEDARRIVDSLKAAGYAFIKTHATMSSPDAREFFFAMMREARRVGIPVVGHVPLVVSNVEASDSGMRSVEHAPSHHQCWGNPLPAAPDVLWLWGGNGQPARALPDSAALDRACTPVAQAYIRNNTWIVPTFARAFSRPRSREARDNLLWVVRTLRRLGVTTFLTGSDWGDVGASFLPGLSVRQELIYLVDAGLTPLEALQAGTRNPAIFLQATDSLGTVAPGKLADLALLDADPLADITNVLKLWAVVANGRYFDRAALDTMDPDAAKVISEFLAAGRYQLQEPGAKPRMRPAARPTP